MGPWINKKGWQGREACRKCDYECQYTLASLEEERFHLQILHEHDDCCFAAAGRHIAVSRYEADVRARLSGLGLSGWFTVATTSGSLHGVTFEDKMTIKAA